jgi:hypothetical protein
VTFFSRERQNSNGYISKIRMSIDDAKLVIKDLLSYWTEVNIVRARDMILSFPRILCTRKSIALNSQIEWDSKYTTFISGDNLKIRPVR